jgi:Prolyl oligopeptidase family
MFVLRSLLTAMLTVSVAVLAVADGPADNQVDKVRPVPPLPKEALPEADRKVLQDAADKLGAEIAALKESLKGKADLLALLPDVQIYHNAIRYALYYNEIFEPKKEVPIAKKLLQTGFERAAALKEGKAPWTQQTGLVPRGYVSKIDGSVQPYGVVVPANYLPNATGRVRLDIWCHGRGETLSELNFLDQRHKSPGEFVAPNTIVLHLYGRYCCANKLAGEIDCFEAMDHAKKHYRIDDNRIVMRGFSMGGAACWQFAVHYPGVWCAAAPGAGFSETAEFLNNFQNEKVQPADYEKLLWHQYDCTDYALNLFNLPTVAYSGENDKQKQAADIMEKALKEVGIELVHIIGPKTGHSYHPDAKKEINRRIDAIAARGRNVLPQQVKFTTWTLRYHQSYWLSVEGLEKHWARGLVEAEIVGRTGIRATTGGITALTFTMPSGLAPFDPTKPVAITIDGQKFDGPKAQSDRSWSCKLQKTDGKWQVVPGFGTALHKRPGLQGPIDDAFLDSFVMVKPTGEAINADVGKFVARELTHAVTHWRQQFRGEAIVKDDKAITDSDIANSNLILWGDPKSNAVLAKIADKLPIQWTADGVVVGDVKFAASHVPLLIYPNPLNPKKYVVLNSGFTFREYDYLNNARQIPKLPDYAIIDAKSPMTSRAAGTVVIAGFFDEQWKLK